jgi:hypothetical protein
MAAVVSVFLVIVNRSHQTADILARTLMNGAASQKWQRGEKFCGLSARRQCDHMALSLRR